MKALAPYTKIDPKDRVKDSLEVVSRLKTSDGLISIKEQQKAEGLVLPRPSVLYSSVQHPTEQGLLKNRGKLQSSHNFKEWMVVYSENKNTGKRPTDSDEIYAAVDILKRAGEAYGIKFQ